jgi:hypothetical protein
MATFGGKTPSRETALALLAQVERQAGVIARRYTGNEAILDRFTEFRTFIDALSEFQLFIDMVENRLGAFGPDERAAQTRKLATIRATVLTMEIETTSLFLDRMVMHDRPWPMGSQKFLRRRLTRLDDIAAFHAAHGADYELTPPDAAQMQNIRERVAAQIDNSVPLADFGDVVAPPPEEPAMDTPVAEAPMPEPVVAPQPSPPHVEAPKPVEPTPKALPPVPVQPDVMIPGMMGFAAPPPSSSPPTSSAAKPPAVAPVLPDLMIPGMIMPAPLAAEPPASEAPLTDDWEPPPPPSASAPPPPSQAASVPKDFDADYVSKKAQAVAKLAASAGPKPEAKTGTPGLARRDFRLKVREEADGYKYIDGNGVAVITESCRVANTTIDELAKNLELSRPGLVLILNGRDPVSTELLKTLRRFVRRTGGLA